MEFLYLRKQVETAQFADNTVHLRQPLPFAAGLEDKKEFRVIIQELTTETFKRENTRKTHKKVYLCLKFVQRSHVMPIFLDIYFHPGAQKEQSCMIISKTKLHRSPDNSIFSPTFTASS